MGVSSSGDPHLLPWHLVLSTAEVLLSKVTDYVDPNGSQI